MSKAFSSSDLTISPQINLTLGCGVNLIMSIKKTNKYQSNNYSLYGKLNVKKPLSVFVFTESGFYIYHNDYVRLYHPTKFIGRNVTDSNNLYSSAVVKKFRKCALSK